MVSREVVACFGWFWVIWVSDFGHCGLNEHAGLHFLDQVTWASWMPFCQCLDHHEVGELYLIIFPRVLDLPTGGWTWINMRGGRWGRGENKTALGEDRIESTQVAIYLSMMPQQLVAEILYVAWEGGAICTDQCTSITPGTSNMFFWFKAILPQWFPYMCALGEFPALLCLWRSSKSVHLPSTICFRKNPVQQQWYGTPPTWFGTHQTPPFQENCVSAWSPTYPTKLLYEFFFKPRPLSDV